MGSTGAAPDMPFEALRNKLRGLGGSRDEHRRPADEAARPRGGPRQPGPSEQAGPGKQTRELAKRLQSSGQMRKPVQDANMKPGEDPREIEKFACGERTVGPWFGETGRAADPCHRYFAAASRGGVMGGAGRRMQLAQAPSFDGAGTPDAALIALAAGRGWWR